MKGDHLALGTATFGMKYGTFNSNGQIQLEEVKKIIQIATNGGIDTIDTAISYGSSEKVLGYAGINSWNVVSKLPAVANDSQPIAEWVESQVRNSLQRLKIKKLYAMLLHKPAQLRQCDGQIIWSTLQKLKDNDLISNIGYSIYDPEELDSLWDDFRPDIVQVPFNLVDRRIFILDGWINFTMQVVRFT